MKELIQAIAVTAELMGAEWSAAAAEMVATELSRHRLESVKLALARCRREMKGRLTLADILDRLPGGHLGVEEAYAVVSRGMHNESLTMVWSDEMREAYGVAAVLVDDPVAARMAFKEKYQQLVAVSRANNVPIAWSVSQGTDKADRERAITEGVKQGRLSAQYAQFLLPHPGNPDTVKLLEQLCPRLLS